MAITDFSLEGKRAVVTGAGRGIGKGIALALAEAGADVAITALTATYAEKVAAQITGMGHRTLMVAADATKPEDMDRLAERVLREFVPWTSS